MYHRNYLFAAVAVAALAAFTLNVAAEEEKKAQVGEAAPAFTLADQDGNEVSLGDFEGQIVVLEWFNIECPYVVRPHEREKSMPALQARYAEQGVVWLAVNSSHDHDNGHNKRTHERLELAYPILNDQSGKIGRTYGATNTPHMYVIDADGILRYAGAIDDDPRGSRPVEERTNYVAQALDAVLAGETVAIAQTRAYGCTVKYKN